MILLIFLDSFMDPQDNRWQGNQYDTLAKQIFDHQLTNSSHLFRISNWFDPPYISPRQEATALPLSIIEMISLFSIVSIYFMFVS